MANNREQALVEYQKQFETVLNCVAYAWDSAYPNSFEDHLYIRDDAQRTNHYLVDKHLPTGCIPIEPLQTLRSELLKLLLQQILVHFHSTQLFPINPTEHFQFAACVGRAVVQNKGCFSFSDLTAMNAL